MFPNTSSEMGCGSRPSTSSPPPWSTIWRQPTGPSSTTRWTGAVPNPELAVVPHDQPLGLRERHLPVEGGSERFRWLHAERCVGLPGFEPGCAPPQGAVLAGPSESKLHYRPLGTVTWAFNIGPTWRSTSWGLTPLRHSTSHSRRPSLFTLRILSVFPVLSIAFLILPLVSPQT